MITDEKRAFKRAPCRFTIHYKRHGENGSGAGVAVSENISLGGVYFTSLEEFKIGQLIDCQVEIPKVFKDSRWVARVVRCEYLENKMINTFGIAAEFVKSFGESEKNLKKILGASRKK